METRDFKGIWIPKEIWLNKDLSMMEKLFLVEIDSLDNADGCFASNKHFAEFFGLSKGRCTQIIKELEAKKLISIEIEREGKLITKRTLRVVNKLNRVVRILNTPSENTKYPYLGNDEENNTSLNNTKDKRKPTRKKFGEYEHVLLTEEQHQKLISEFGELKIREYIKKVDEYCQMYGKKYTDYNLTIRKWINTDKTKEPSAEPSGSWGRML